MAVYDINFTDSNKALIPINEEEINTDLDIVLFGRKRLEYGEQMNENLLHILERFACPEDAGNPGNPDLSVSAELVTGKQLLSTPIEGQFWFNATTTQLNIWNGTIWVPLATFGDIAANWGVITDGQQIPLPVSSTGYVFSRDECSWMVSPHTYPNVIDNMVTSADDNGFVTMQYSLEGSATSISGLANYLIVGIRDNVNLGDTSKPLPSATPSPSVTPTVTPSVSVATSPTPTPTVTVTPSASGGPAVSVTPTVTPTSTPPSTATPTPSNTPAPGVSVTPTRTPTPTPSNTPDPSVTPTVTPTQSAPLVTPTPTATNTPTVTPTVTPSNSIAPSILPFAFTTLYNGSAGIDPNAGSSIGPVFGGDGAGIGSPNYRSETPAADPILGQYASAGPGSLYEIQAVLVSGPTPTAGDALGVFLPLTTERSWFRIIPTVVVDSSTVLSVTIREIANPLNSLTNNVNIEFLTLN